jgi:HSP20 family protein
VGHVDDDKTQHDSAKPADKDGKKSFGLGGLLGGLAGLIEELGELASAEEQLARSGDLKEATEKIHGVFGINVKTALSENGQAEFEVQPFGNVRRGPTEHPDGSDIREPLVDVQEEEDHVLVLVELPGVAKENIKLRMSDGRLWLLAERGKTTYRKEVDVPQGCSPDKMAWECNNGILQVRFSR